jgi:2-phospho-L-lactate guanylyltransferase
MTSATQDHQSALPTQSARSAQSVWAVIPSRGLADGKRRLADALPPERREALNRKLLMQVISAAGACPQVTKTIVVSPDPAALTLAGESGVEAMREHGGPDLNQALAQAAAAAAAGDAAILVVPADLPWLTGADLQAMLENADGTRQCIIVSDQRGNGTNALYVQPAAALPFCFGPDSLKMHTIEAERRNIAILHYRNDDIAFDIDQPEDLLRYQRHDGEPAESVRPTRARQA